MRCVVMSIMMLLLVLFACAGNADRAALDGIAAEKGLPLYADTDHNYEGSLVVYHTTLYQKPPYYRGSSDLEYDKHVIPAIGGWYGSSEQVKIHVFDDFFITYIHEPGSANIGAIAADKKTREPVAEAHLEIYSTGEKGYGFRAEEFYYDSEMRLIYYCQSEVEFGSMFKTDVLKELGRKQEEYFFLWPSFF